MQSLQLRCKEPIRKVPIVSKDGKYFILLNDIQVVIKHPMTRFIPNGEPLEIEIISNNNNIIDCKKDKTNKYDTPARDEDKEQLLNELRELIRSELAQRDEKLDKIIWNTELSIKKDDAILRQTFQLVEYPIPRSFIILPEPKTRLNPANWWMHSYRLYFICECECESERHLAFHKGYPIKEPRLFFRKYGPYLKNTIRAARVTLLVSGFVMPPIGSLAGFTDQIPSFLFQRTFQGGLSRNLDKMLNVIDNALKENLTPATMNNSHGINTVEGADLREIASFLQKTDDRNSYGNLQRSTDERGEVRWLCFMHHPTFSSEEPLKSLRQDFRQLGGELRLGTAIIDESSVKNLDKMLDVLVRGLSIVKMVFTNCKIRMKTFEKLLFIATQRNLIDHIEFRDVLISPSVGFIRLHSEIIPKLEEAIIKNEKLTIQYIVSSPGEIFEKKNALSTYFAMNCNSRLLLKLHSDHMFEQFSCSGLTDSDLNTVREWIRETQSSWKIRTVDANRVVFIDPLGEMKEFLLPVTKFLLGIPNLRQLDYYHTTVNSEVLQTLCEALENNTTSLKSLHFNESRMTRPLSVVTYFTSLLANRKTLSERIGSICASHITRMLKGNKSLTEISFPTITELQPNDMLKISQAIGTHSSLSTVKIGSLPTSSTNPTSGVFSHLLQNPSIEDFTCTVNGDEEFKDLRNALEKNKTLKRLSIHIFNQNQTAKDEGFCQNVSRLPALETLTLSFSIMNDCRRLLRLLSTKCLVKNLSLTRVSNWRYLINFIDEGWKLTSLTLSHCDISFSDIERITTSFKSNSQSIVELNLSNNNLSDGSANELGSLLRDSPPLTILTLSNNTFSLSCILNLIKALHSNTSLKILDIRSCFKWNHQQGTNSTDLQELKKAIANLADANELVDIQWND